MGQPDISEIATESTWLANGARQQEWCEIHKHSKELSETILNSLGDGIFVTDDKGLFTFIGGCASAIFGYSLQEMKQLGNISALIGENLLPLGELKTATGTNNIEREITDKKGIKHNLLISIKPINLTIGTILYACRDITNLKKPARKPGKRDRHLQEKLLRRIYQLEGINQELRQQLSERQYSELAREHSEQRYRSIVETQIEVICRVFPDGTISFINEAACRYFQKEKYQLLGASFYSFIPANERKIIEQTFLNFSATELIKTQEHNLIDGKGNNQLFQWVQTAIVDRQGNLKEFQVVGREIRAIPAIKSSLNPNINWPETEETVCIDEQLYRTMARNFPKGAVVLFDHDLRYILAEGSGLAEAGLERTKVEGKTIWEVWPADVCAVIESDYRAALAGVEKVSEVCYANRTYSCHTVPLKNEIGAITGGLVVTQDISERKQMEVELRHSQQKYKTLFDIFPTGISITDAAGNLVEANPASEKILGIFSSEHTQRKYDDQEWQIIKSDGTPMPPSEFASVKALTENRLVENVEMGIVKGKDDIIWISVTAAPIPLEGYGVAISYTDITERKKAEASLYQREQELRALVENAPDLIGRIDRELRYLYINPAIENMMGLTREFVLGKTNAEIGISEPILSVWQQALSSVFATGQEKTIEIEIPTIQGLKTYQPRLFPEFGLDGSVVSVLVISRDITEHKRMQQSLTQQRDFLNALVETVSEGITVSDEAGNLLVYNRQMEEITGYSLQEAQNKDILSLLYPEPQIRNACTGLEATFQGKNVNNAEWEMKRKDGEKRNALICTRILNYGGQKLLLGSVRDITERKRTEEEMHRTQLFLNSIIENLPSMVFVKEAENLEFVSLNKAGEQLLGYCREELLGKNDYDFFPKEQADFFTLKDRELLTTGQLLDIEEPIATRHNGIRLLHTKKIPIQDEIGGGKYILGISEDITEIKRAEKTLRQQKEILQTIFDHIPIMVAFYNSTGKIELINRKLEIILGWTLEEAQKIDLLAECYPDDSTRQKVLDSMLASTGEWIDFKARTRNGDYIETSWVNIRLSDGTRIGIGQDITQRKQAEKALRRQAEQDRLMAATLERIRQSLNLDEILDTTVAEVLQILKCDRVFIMRLQANLSGSVIAESAKSPQPKLLGTVVNDEVFSPELYEHYCQGNIRVIAKKDSVTCGEYWRSLIGQKNLESTLIVPILQKNTLTNLPDIETENQENKNHLWGLLIADASQRREWQEWEINLLASLASQVGIAIQQAQLYCQLKQANEELNRLATVDGLTLVANRRRFDEYLQQEWHRLAREKAPLSLLFCDVDFFKLYNDSYGHQAGDECLKLVAGAMQEAVRRKTDLVARYGGEEFAVILPNTNTEVAMHVAEMIRSAIQQLHIPHSASRVSDYVTLSLGSATLMPVENRSPEILIAIADQALYQAKQQGRDRLVMGNG